MYTHMIDEDKLAMAKCSYWTEKLHSHSLHNYFYKEKKNIYITKKTHKTVLLYSIYYKISIVYL